LLVVDRWELPVMDYGRDPLDPATFGRPRSYQLQPAYGGVSFRIHASRVIRMGGVPLPRRLMLRRQGWDGSVFDLVYAQLRAYGSSHAYAAEALSLLTQGVLQSPGLDAALETTEGPAVVQARLEAMRLAEGIFSTMAIGEKETYTVHARPLSGIGDAIKAAVDALVVVSDMPKAVLLGEMPGGLNRGAISPEMQIWYDHCSSQHREHYTPPLRRILDLVFRSHEGPTRGQVPHGWTVEWRPLVQESADALAQRRLILAQARAADIAAMLVSPAEVRAGDRDLQEQYGLDPAALAEPPLDPTAEPQVVEAGDDAVELAAALAPAGPSQDEPPADLVDPRDVAERLGVSTRRVTGAMARGPQQGGLRWWPVYGKRMVSMAEALAKVRPAN
jgi:phage-related protein (TIGR01555 family)